MSKINELELQSKTIDWLRFPLALLVIYIHMNPVVNIKNIDFSNFGWSSLFNLTGIMLSQTIGGIAVPCFLMFSGYLFFIKVKEWNKNEYFAKVKIRIMTLFVPYILFNLLAIFFEILPSILKADGSMDFYLDKLLANWYRIFWSYTSWSPNFENILGQPLSLNYGPFLLPLWYLRDLIVMVIISPIVYCLLKLTKIWGLVILFFFFYTKIWFEMPEYSSRLFLTAFLFFSIGAYFGINKKNLVVSLRKHQLIWLVIALISLYMRFYNNGIYFNQYFSPIFVLSGVISLVNITSHLIELNKLQVRETLAKSSFFIYCLHCILILGNTHKLVRFSFEKVFGLDSEFRIFATYFITPLITAGVILCIYLLMKRFTPKLLSLFTGNRY